ncbi:MAG: alpha/beta hydrolase [Bacteroidota bacterium]
MPASRSERLIKEVFILLVLFGCFCNTLAQVKDYDNLKHPQWQVTTDVNKVGDLIKIGSGKKNLVLITGSGFDNSIFYEFMMRNKDIYTCYAFTEAGMGNTLPPPIDKNQKYGDRNWSIGFEGAVANFISEDNLKDVILLGFFSGGVQHAVHIAYNNPELIKKVILVSGEIQRDFVREPLTLSQRDSLVTNELAERWFKNLSPKTWYEGTFPATIFSNDSIKSRRLWEKQNMSPIPSQIQLLCEFFADDLGNKIVNLKQPVKVIVPGFDESFINDEKNALVYHIYNRKWHHFIQNSAPKNVSLTIIDDAKIFVFEDKSDEFDRVLKEFVTN